MSLLERTISCIGCLDKEIQEQASKRMDNLIKPQGSLGKLEELYIKLSGITGTLNPKVDKKAVIVMAADHGVFEEGIAAYPQAVTAIQTDLFTKGVTGVCAIADLALTDVVTVDIGVATDIDNDKVINKKIKHGTNNMTKGPAMTREEAIQAIEVGIQVAQAQIDKGVNMLAIGDMGIGNTTASAAIVAVVGKIDASEVTGLGANFPEAKLQHKVNIINKAITMNEPNPEDGIDVVSKVGGLEIAGMAGVMLAGAANKIPVVIDGFISTAAALIASTIEPKIKEYLIPSHLSEERGAKLASSMLGFEPMLHLNMRLGEGSGAVLAFHLIEAAIHINKKMITFEEAGIEV